MGGTAFTWRDAERTILFGAGRLASAPQALRDAGWGRFELLTTRRALATGPPELAECARRVHEVPHGPVPDVAAQLIDGVEGPHLVAFGGGRVIDAAKAVAAVRGGRAAALPTTLSGAELTAIHRLPRGRQAPALVRPRLVLADPDAMTGLDEPRLRASAMNALAHGAEPLYTPLANPVATMAALRGAALIAAALDAFRDGSLPHDAAADLALGSLLCAYALGSAGFALHHVVCQTLVRVLEIPHADTNAVMLPRTMAAMRERVPEPLADLAAALDCEPDVLGARLEELGGGRRTLSELGAERSRRDEAVDAMLERRELELTPQPPRRQELERLLDSAW